MKADGRTAASKTAKGQRRSWCGLCRVLYDLAGRRGPLHVQGVPCPPQRRRRPRPPPPGLDAKALLGDIGHGFWAAIAHSPWWIDALFAAVMLSAVVRLVRGIVHGGHPKDAVRWFSHADRRMIFIRAGDN